MSKKSDIDVLLKIDDNKAEDNISESAALEKSKKFSYNKRAINGICQMLCEESNCYKPEITVKSIEEFIRSYEKMDRILYSEISNYIFYLSVNKRATFASNMENLLLCALDENDSMGSECREMIIRIYDHFQLALHQIENANNIFAESIEEAKINLQKEVKGIEKEYISILGIFAAIVLAFVGGITFSSSVLQNIDHSSIFRLLLVMDSLAAVLINVIYMLIKFIMMINREKKPDFNMKGINIFFMAAGVIIILGWLLNVQEIPQFLEKSLPW